MMAAMFAYVSGASFVLQDGFGLDARTFGLVFGLNAAGLTLTSQLNPVLLRRFTVRQVLSGAIVGAMAAAAALLVVGLTGFGGLARRAGAAGAAGLARRAWRCPTPRRWR